MMLPGQMRMHWPHRMQRARKRASSRAPGGRMRLASRFAPACPPTPHMEARTSPDPATIKPRLDRSGNPTSPAAEALPAKVTRPAGQRSRQFMHITHSPAMKVPDGRQAPSQYSSQMQQSPHLSAVLPMRQGEKRPNRPNSAPSGQMNRQKNRGRTRFKPTTPRNTTPMNQAEA